MIKAETAAKKKVREVKYSPPIKYKAGHKHAINVP